MPGIADRPMAERFAVLQSIFAGEYKKIDRKLVVEREPCASYCNMIVPATSPDASDIPGLLRHAFLESVSKPETPFTSVPSG